MSGSFWQIGEPLVPFTLTPEVCWGAEQNPKAQSEQKAPKETGRERKLQRDAGKGLLTHKAGMKWPQKFS